VPRTRREQGVPFFVRAPQMETISAGSVGRSVAVPSALKPSGRALPVASVSLPAVETCDASVGAGGFSALRSMISGGGAGRIARPPTKPTIKSPMHATSGRTTRPRRNLWSHPSQKRRLVHTRQRTRAMRPPHSAQKFGLYMVRKSPLRVRTRRHCRCRELWRVAKRDRAGRFGACINVCKKKHCCTLPVAADYMLKRIPARKLFLLKVAARFRFTRWRALHTQNKRVIVAHTPERLRMPLRGVLRCVSSLVVLPPLASG
jgi:hypothetical protein